MASYRLAIVLVLCLAASGDRPAATWQNIYSHSLQSLNQADFEAARKTAASGFRAWCTRPHSEACAQFRLLLAESLVELDRLDEALALLSPAAPGRENSARRSADLAMLHLRKHEMEPALQSLAEARAQVLPQDFQLQGKINLISGSLAMVRDQLPEAEESFRRALASVEGSQSLIESYTLTDLGFLDLRRFRYDEALYWYGKARDLAAGKGMKRALELATVNVGAAYLNLGDFDRAIQNLEQAVKMAEQLNDRVYEVPALVLLGESWSRAGDLNQAAECYQRARKLGNPDRDRWLGNVLDDLSQVSLQKGDLASAADLNTEGIALSRRLEGPDALIPHMVQSGNIALTSKQYPKAEKIYRETLAASSQAGDLMDAFECHAALSTLYRQTGASAKAAAEFQAAASSIDRLHSGLQRDESKFSFVASMIAYYRDYVDFLYDRGDVAAAFQVAESSRARVLEERLHRQNTAPVATNVQALSKEAGHSKTVLLSYWLAPQRSLLWVVDGSGIHPFRLPGEADIAAQVHRYDDAIQRGDNPVETGNEAGRWLSANLVGVAHLPKDTQVVIEPDGALYQLNFETLPTSDGGHYWIEQASVSIAPSLELLQESAYSRAGRLLAFGDPGYDGTEFQQLSNVKAELQAVESHFTDKAVYVSAAATPAAYRASHPDAYSILHFATHAVANRESPLDSAIILAGTPDSRKLYAREILQEPLKADLVTLSACETAGSRTYSGEGLTGFSWAFLSAGARNVVAGLWDVDDRATSRLMKSFYDRLSEGLTPANALRRAKLDLMASGGAYRKPRYWAAFEIFTRALYN